MIDSIKKNFHKIEATGAIVGVLVLTLFFFSSPGITGFLSLDFTIQNLNMEVDRGQSFLLTSSSEAPFYLTSFKLGGEIIGEGVVEVYIEDGQGKELLVFRNVKHEKADVGHITGFFVNAEGDAPDPEKGNWLIIAPIEDSQLNNMPNPLEEDEISSQGVFSNECKDTCFMKMELSNKDSYKINFKIEPGTILKLDNIVYTIETEVE